MASDEIRQEWRAAMEANIRSILVPTDFSAASQRAVDYARVLGAALGASVHLVHVLDRLLSPQVAWAAPALEAAALRDRLYQDARSKLAVISPTFEAIRVPATTEVRGGAAGSEIVKAAVDYGADLIVMTTHGRSGLPHLVLGSVAEHVIRHARCPVLAIRANETETTEGAGIQGIGRVA
jgi:universal stress protein A